MNYQYKYDLKYKSNYLNNTDCKIFRLCIDVYDDNINKLVDKISKEEIEKIFSIFYIIGKKSKKITNI